MPNAATLTEEQLQEIEARPSVQAAWSQRIELRVEERDALCRSLRAAWANELRLAQEVVTLRTQFEYVDKQARSTLAQKVLEIVAAEHLDGYIEGEPGEHAADRGRREDDIAYDTAINHVSAALRELFQREGIEVES